MSSADPATSSASPPDATPQPWLVRISEVFAPVAEEVLARFGASTHTRLGADFYSVKTATPEAIRQSPASVLSRWNIPLEHSWPCHPAKMEGFVEKAAQTLVKKFGPRSPQQLLIGQLNPGSPDPYYKSLASNLRGRALQLFPAMKAKGVEDQDSQAPTLFCLVGKEGLFCGISTPQSANGFYAGGSLYVAKDTPDTISRAGAKIAEALHYLKLYRPALPTGSHWLELGACPGGMTSELLVREFRVTALDRSPLDRRLFQNPALVFHQMDVAEFRPAREDRYDAILDDMNGEPEESIRQVIRLSRQLRRNGIIVFTLKLPKVETVEAPLQLRDEIVAKADAAGLKLFAQTHLTYNRHELTLFFEKAGE
ncbi:SAM-dependent methyltransferase [Verrucomicrobium sp. BvORR106]|uniref:SAM-dependent methyltransferase n=1 Tax=Verrucomicrobium sp. BvORR106 TaxID=1403819 RepID=UPI000571C855|nr:SAM-dependent methyltransferase [Verrucomicrobium sp. BvORR106]